MIHSGGSDTGLLVATVSASHRITSITSSARRCSSMSQLALQSMPLHGSVRGRGGNSLTLAV